MTKETPDNGFADVLQDAKRERYSLEDKDPEEREATMPTGQKLTNLLHSYPVQMFAEVPNRAKSSESWCCLDPKRWSELTFDIFCSMSGLQDAFESYMLFVCECTKWDQTVWALIPDIKEWENTRDWQGLPALTARNEFVELLQSQPEQNWPAIVTRACEYVNDRWLWLPFGPRKKHMWSTGKANLPKSTTQFGPVIGGPWIVLNTACMIR
ncbi:hypothetical protein FRC07_007268 [Ceratobasidium sp. 392]|nr:hypothetical protein FRC07_007268 [Ceratobasidium sp. 392]